MQATLQKGMLRAGKLVSLLNNTQLATVGLKPEPESHGFISKAQTFMKNISSYQTLDLEMSVLKSNINLF